VTPGLFSVQPARRISERDSGGGSANNRLNSVRSDELMNDSAWHWARLDRNGIALVQETEAALGADIVLAYGPGGPVADPSILTGLEPVALNESQLDCLRGVESKLGIVAVAYSRAH